MDETVRRPLRIESLNPTHLARWPELNNGDDLPRFQEFLLGDWLSRFEQRFPDLIPSRSPRCLVALDGDRVVASVVARPFNRRGSCWTLQLPEQHSTDCCHSLRTIQQALLQQALQRGAPQVCSWVIRCTTTDADAIALMRELGFQPLRAYQQCLPPKSTARRTTPPLPTPRARWASRRPPSPGPGPRRGSSGRASLSSSRRFPILSLASPAFSAPPPRGCN